MKYHILFSDMDGTLLNDKKEISEALYEKIEQFTKKGGKLVLSSGRPLAGILKTKEQLGLSYPGMYLIAYNGAMIYDCQKEEAVFEKRLPFEYVEQVMKIAAECGVHCQTYSDTHIITERETKELQAYRKHIPMPYQVVKNAARYLESISQKPFKLIAIESQPEKLKHLNEELLKRLEGKIHTVFSANNYLEIIHKDVSKGNAIRILCDQLKVPIEGTVAAGDAANDISMLKTAGIGVAMKNATEETKEAADYVTEKTNNEDGMLEIFERWLEM